ncbi:MAG: hypothetical protein CMH52_00630 [Myxococcales bacterium]|nr:hypothetical protein [Myxococcales bacterium]
MGPYCLCWIPFGATGLDPNESGCNMVDTAERIIGQHNQPDERLWPLEGGAPNWAKMLSTHSIQIARDTTLKAMV